MDFLPTSILFPLLRALLVSGEYFQAVTTAISKVAQGIQSAFHERVYIFLEGYSAPFPEHAVNLFASSSAALDFYYNADKKQFSTGAGTSRRLPALSLEIVRDGVVAFDLTDFIEKVTVVTEEEFPSVSQIVHAWMIDSHVILSRTCEFVARIVSEDGSTHECSVRNELDMAEAMSETEEVPLATEGEEGEGEEGEGEEATEEAEEATEEAEEAEAAEAPQAPEDQTVEAPDAPEVAEASQEAPTEPLKIE